MRAIQPLVRRSESPSPSGPAAVRTMLSTAPKTIAIVNPATSAGTVRRNS
jgi:hypothetical protein